MKKLLKGLAIAAWAGVLPMACGAAQIAAPGNFSGCEVLSYAERASTTAAQQASSPTNAPRRLLSAAPGQATLERSWVVRSSSNSNVTYAVKQTLNAATGGEISMCAYSPNRVIATLLKGKSYADFVAGMTSRGFKVVRELMKDLQGNSVYVIESTDTEHDVVDQMTASIQSSGFCDNATIARDHIYSANMVPNDGKWADQWNMVKIGAPKAWNTRTDASSVLVAVLDTGVNFDHIDLNQNLWMNPIETADMGNGEDDDGNGIVDDVYGISSDGGNVSGNPMDENGHGSHCAGIIGAVGNNRRGVAGVAWRAKIMGLKFLNADGNGCVSDAITCLSYAAEKGVKIINCSFGSTDWDDYFYMQVQIMAQRGVLFVCAAGNATNGMPARDNDEYPFYPCNYPCSNIVAVAATDADDNLASFSYFGAQNVDIAAPGVDIESSVLGSMTYDYKSGTSMATPHVVGALALLMAEYPDESPYDIVERLYAAGEEVASLKGKVRTGKRLSLANFFGLPAPSAVTASQGTILDAVSLYWTAVENASHYRVWRADAEDGAKTALCEWTRGLTFSDETALPGSNYWYFVQAAASAEGADASAYSEGVPGFRPEIPEDRVTVSFDANGGTVAEPKRNYTAGDPYGEFPAATYAEHVFLGWHTAATGGTRMDAASVVKADVTTLFAHWAMSSELRVENLSAQQRYPWNGKVDVMFDLNGVPEKEYASLALTAKEEGEGQGFALVTYDGNAPTNLPAGNHRVIWNADADKPNALFENLTLNATASIDVPRAPASGTASNNVAAGGIDLAWTAAHGASSYEIWRSTSSTLGSAEKLLDCAELTCLDGSCTMGTYYYYWIKSKSSGGTSPDALALEARRGLKPPENVRASDGTSSEKVTVTWTASDGATGYDVYRSTGTSSGSATKIASVTTTSCDDTSATAGQQYYYWVKATVPGYASEFSAYDGGYRKKIPTALAINGVSSVNAGASATYTATATYNDNSTATVTPNWSLTSGASYGSINASGVFSARGTVTQRSVTIGASYTVDGVTVTTTMGVTIATYTVTVTFNGNNGTPSSQTQSYTAYGTYGSFPSVSWVGYTFNGWYTASSGGSQVTTSSTVPSANTTLYAHWSGNSYTISFNANGGSGSMSNVSMMYGTAKNLPANVFTRTGYSFAGWATSSSGSVAYANGASVNNLTTTSGGTVVLYAKWTPISYTIRFNANGGSGSMGDLSMTYDVSKNLTANAFTMTGYSFIGWATTSGGSVVYENGASVKNLTTSNGSTVTLYAKWQANIPSAPTDVSATDGQAGSVTVSWSAVSIATSYEIWRNTSSSTSGAEKIATSTTTSFTDTTAPISTTCYYWVKAVNAMGTSGWSSYDSGYRVLGIPANVSASDNTLALGIRITWDAVDGADSYAIYRGTSTASGSATQIGTSMGPAYIDSEVATGTTYYYFIKAVAAASGTTSDFSSYDKGSRKAGEPLYVVVDLSGGTTAGNYPISELSAVPSGGWTDEYKTNKLVLRRIANGVFMMGSRKGDIPGQYKDIDLHHVTIGYPFYMGVFEVTQKQYEHIIGQNPSPYQGDARPAGNVSYDMIRGGEGGAMWPSLNIVDAMSFMGKIRARTGLSFDLPTEAQWEYACRAGTTTALNSGKELNNAGYDDNMNEVGRYAHNCGEFDGIVDGRGGFSNNCTTVGSYLGNNWGLYDMHGNVCEWCLDWYVSSLGLEMAIDPLGATSGSERVVRGGSHSFSARSCISSSRDHQPPSVRYTNYGFRLCCPAGLMLTPPTGVSATDGTSAAGVTVTWNSVSGATSYNIWRGVHNASGAAEKIGTATGTSYTDSNAEAGKQYWYWIEAVNSSYSSGFTAWDTGYRKLGSPFGVSATAGTGANTISWSAVADATSYKILRGTSTTYANAEQIGTATTATYTDATALPGQGYYYWVVAVNEQGESAPSSYVYTSGWQLAAPTGVSASDNSLACGVRVMWNAVEGADGYVIYRGTSSSSGSVTQIGTSMGPAYIDSEVATGTTYYYFIKATRGSVASAFSAYDTGSRKSGTPLYVVVDLSGGTTAANYPISELSSVPSDGWTDEYKTNKLVLRRIANGSFTMGCETSEVGYYGYEAQPHQVTISKPFYMGVFEVTQKQYQLVMGSNPSSYKGDARPVECVSYNTIRGSSEGAKWPSANSVDSTSFMGKIRARTGLTFDLPTEAQWEYACRAGTTTALNSGKNLTSTSSDANMAELGRYYYNSTLGTYDGKGQYSQHAVVGSYLPNNWGLYDMHGNVWEWCLDWYVSRGASGFDSGAVTDPKGSASGSDRVVRGGGWGNDAQGCRSASRLGNPPSGESSYVGFRLCCSAGGTTDQVTVSFNANGGTGTMPSVSVGNGGSMAIPKVAFARTGYTFTGWATSTSGSVVYADGATVASVTANVTLVAKWTAIVPNAPSNVSATDGEYSDKVIVSWASVSGVTKYYIYRNTSNDSATATEVGNTTSDRYADTAAIVGTTYYYWIKSYRSDSGQYSSFSLVSTGYAHLNSPRDVKATSSPRVSISWSSVSDATSYKVMRGTTSTYASSKLVGTVTTTGFDDETSEPGTDYYYWIVAVCANGESEVSASAFLPAWTLAVPSNVLASDGTDMTGVQISWSAVPNATSYQILRDGEPLATVTSNEYFDKNAVMGMRYKYSVKSCGGSVSSTSSSEDAGWPRLKLTGKYVIIDMSAGTNAWFFPVTQVNSEPTGGWTKEHLSKKLVMRRVEPGTFMMGSSSNPKRVTLTKPFYIGIYQMTVAQMAQLNEQLYKAGARFGGFSTSTWKRTNSGNGIGSGGYEDYSSWLSEAGCYCTHNRVVQPESYNYGGYIGAEDITDVLTDKCGPVFGLPTSAEWEYACRAGTATAYNNGLDYIDIVTNVYQFSTGYYAAQIVASPRCNRWGICDMHTSEGGEWVRDKWGTTDEVIDPCVLVAEKGPESYFFSENELRNTPEQGRSPRRQVVPSYYRTSTQGWGQTHRECYRPFCYADEPSESL